jgi:hypothetical protein
VAVFHEPSRRLGTEEDAEHEDKGRDERRAKLQAPCDVARVLDDDVGREAEEDAYMRLSVKHVAGFDGQC